MTKRTKNVFEDLPGSLPQERIEEIVQARSVTIERIISDGHASPAGFWYDQDQEEWVILLKGSAAILFEDANEEVLMNAGDHLRIPAHKRHRVQWTRPGEKTLWLAVRYENGGAP